jgi:hypothetical protein
VKRFDSLNKRFRLATAVLFLAGWVSWLVSGAVIDREAHRRADSILWPLLVAAMNEYGQTHGGPNQPGHLDALDAKDIERIKNVRQAFREWSKAMEQAGY